MVRIKPKNKSPQLGEKYHIDFLTFSFNILTLDNILHPLSSYSIYLFVTMTKHKKLQLGSALPSKICFQVLKIVDSIQNSWLVL